MSAIAEDAVGEPSPVAGTDSHVERIEKAPPVAKQVYKYLEGDEEEEEEEDATEAEPAQSEDAISKREQILQKLEMLKAKRVCHVPSLHVHLAARGT